MHSHTRMTRGVSRVSRVASLLGGATLFAALIAFPARPAHAVVCGPVTNFLAWFSIDDVVYPPGAEATITNTKAVEIKALITRKVGKGYQTFDVSCDPNLTVVSSGTGVVEKEGATNADDPSCPYEVEYEPSEGDVGKNITLMVFFHDPCTGGLTYQTNLVLKVRRGD